MRCLALAVACATALAGAQVAHAHALDEYVQALRVGVSAKSHTLSLSLTPGMHVAGDVLRRIDVNSDGVLSPNEAERYARAVIADVSVSVDGATVNVSLVRVELPPVAEIRDGQGVIRVELSAPAPATRGRHLVVVRNSHLPVLSVYLANALLPDEPGIRILSQQRDSRQQTFWLEYEAVASPAATWAWPFLASASLLILAWSRQRPRQEGAKPVDGRCRGRRCDTLWSSNSSTTNHQCRRVLLVARRCNTSTPKCHPARSVRRPHRCRRCRFTTTTVRHATRAGSSGPSCCLTRFGRS